VRILPDVLDILPERLKKVRFVSGARLGVRHNDSRTTPYRTALEPRRSVALSIPGHHMAPYEEF
jgi:hypothetical protein